MNKVTVHYMVDNGEQDRALTHIHNFNDYLDLLESIKKFGFLVLEDNNTAVAVPYHRILEIRYRGD